ncbi:MAG: pitrilysin family protein [Bacteroidales bacterium]|nr:pitrilysin family protein [Bacteroidales bacterium]
MIRFERFELENGLKVLLHKDITTEIVAVNILYDVGSRDEDEHKTGLAHLFEHLMFEGSKNIPKYDEPLQKVGGSNNAFTSNDLTNYYLTLPKANLETAFWLESDRMLELNFCQEKLDIQRKVVIEEFKQSYLNKAYGDSWAVLRKMVYKVHPYKWSTIGKNIAHIENATLEDVKDFYFRFYRPNNAILVVVGNITMEELFPLVKKWFGDIPSGIMNKRNLPIEPVQREARYKTIIKDVPSNKIFKAYHACDRRDEGYYSLDMLSDVLSNGKSSRLYRQLVRKQKIFSQIDAYITGSIDSNLLVVEATLNEGIDIKKADMAIVTELEKIRKEAPSLRELNKVKNKIEMNLELGMLNILNKAYMLAYNELIDGNTMSQNELILYQKVTAQDIQKTSEKVLNPKNCSTLYYLKK